MTYHSPFSKSRYEHDGRHMYYIQKKTLEILEGDVPIIISGSRGTGKTTLLKSINWREQKENNFLSQALKENNHRNDYIGLYIKLPELKINSFSFWEMDQCQIYPLIFSLYLELVWMQEAINAVLILSQDATLKFSAHDEINCVKRILLVNKKIFGFEKENSTHTLFDLLENVVSVRKQIENACIYKQNIEDVYKMFGSIDQIGFISNTAALELVKLINNEDGLKKFKICMDECECLSEKQLLVIKTMLRLTKFPVFYVFSFISPISDTRETLIPNITNQKADVQKISLDDMDKKDFEDFSNGVATVRISSELKEPAYAFNLSNILGHLSINTLLESLLKKSVSPLARNLLKNARERLELIDADNTKDDIPIYQSYLIDKLELDESSSEEKWEIRNFESQQQRKKMVAAYLSICKDLKTDPMYAYADMVYGISDRSIRDFLWQLDEIFKLHNKNLKDFISSKIDIETQNKAIKESSTKKLISLPKSAVNSPDNVGKLVYGLSILTEIIQTRSDDNSHLRSPERGIFSFEYYSADSELVKFIQDASEAGFLKTISHKENSIKFRVHSSLAPCFNFSYRGSYYETSIKGSHLMQFINCKSHESLSKTALSIAESIYKISSKQDRLF